MFYAFDNLAINTAHEHTTNIDKRMLSMSIYKCNVHQSIYICINVKYKCKTDETFPTKLLISNATSIGVVAGVIWTSCFIVVSVELIEYTLLLTNGLKPFECDFWLKIKSEITNHQTNDHSTELCYANKKFTNEIRYL